MDENTTTIAPVDRRRAMRLTTSVNEKGTHIVHRGVRRLTVVERERVMGWPDDWTRYGRTASGELVTISRTARHRLTGNGVVAPVAHAIVAHWLRRMDIERVKEIL